MTLPGATTIKLVIAILCALALALLVHDRNRWKSTSTVRQQQLVAEKGAHLATVAGYRAAAEQARRDDAANRDRVEREQARINERTQMNSKSALPLLALVLASCAAKQQAPQAIPVLAEQRRCPAFSLPPQELLKPPVKIDFLAATR